MILLQFALLEFFKNISWLLYKDKHGLVYSWRKYSQRSTKTKGVN
jgi:hypothetical protein